MLRWDRPVAPLSRRLDNVATQWPGCLRAIAPVALLAREVLFYEQNNLSAFKKMFLEQVEFAMKEYF